MGSQLLAPARGNTARLLTSPTTLVLVAALAAAIAISVLRYRGRLRLLAPVVALGVLLLVSVLALATVRPDAEYGVYLDREAGEVVLRYMARSEARAPLCGSTLKLATPEEALAMLERRDLGLSDPFSGVHMGVYTVEGGKRGYVIILEDSGEALIVESPRGEVLIAGVPGAGGAYEALVEASSLACR